ncbi:MAG: NADPH-dependent glutamate synthase [bacterium]
MEEGKKKKGGKKIVPRKYPMPEQTPAERVRNFDEVPYGYDEATAALEAKRCLQCKKPTCVEGCPVGIDIPKFIYEIAQGNLEQSIRIMKSQNALPAVCGRVCPQETQCEAVCVLAKKHEPVAIGRLERFIADWERRQGVEAPKMEAAPGAKAAVIGGGPAGLTCAGDLARLGHEVTIFEALHVPGGVLVYGIPEFRLPKEIVAAEIDYIRTLGVEIRKNMVIGKVLTLEELFADGFRAVFIGTGAGLPMFMNIPGEQLNGIYSANEYLTRINLMRAYRFPEWDTPIRVGRRVAVLGAGNVAMDAARCSLRLPGVEEVTIVYRRTEAEMPAREEEIEHARQEGVRFELLRAPVRYTGDERGNVKAMEVIKNELGEPDASGRRRPVPIEGSEYTVEVDTVVVAIGQRPSPLVPRTTPGLKTTRWGTVETDEATGRTSLEGVFAGGDVSTGAATVISAMGAGKKAAASIHDYLLYKAGK